jgi:predicted permease
LQLFATTTRATGPPAGLVLQRHPARDRLLRLLWTVSFSVLGPLTSLYAFSALGVSVPPLFFLAALTPPAAHLLVLSRLFSLRPALMRLLVLGSTALTLTGVAVAAAV